MHSAQGVPKLVDWCRKVPVCPVVFEGPGVLTDEMVHLHLEQRVAQLLLARFLSLGFLRHNLLWPRHAQATDSIARVILLGRLLPYVHGAKRLYEELVMLPAHWIQPTERKWPLRACPSEAEVRTLDPSEVVLTANGGKPLSDEVQRRLLDADGREIEEPRTHLKPRTKEFAAGASQMLQERRTPEASNLSETQERQRKRVQKELVRHKAGLDQLKLDFGADEAHQLEANMRH